MSDDEERKPVVRTPQRVQVRNDTEPKKLGWALYKFWEESKLPHIVGVGVGAIGAGAQGVAVANGYLAPMGYVFDMFPRFTVAAEEHAHGGDLKALVLELRERKL